MVRSIIFTVLAINIMLAALIIGKEMIPVTVSIPSMGKQASKPRQNIEYIMEKTGADRWEANQDGQGYWVIEHYKEYEVHKDGNGKVIEKRPTEKEEHLRYWKDSK